MTISEFATRRMRSTASRLAMNLSERYLEVVARGAAVLREAAARYRAAATQQPASPELWLSVRDLEGLSGRLADSSDWEWRHGLTATVLSPQDLGVLAELLAREGAAPATLSDEDITALMELRAFLRQYCDGEFSLEEL